MRSRLLSPLILLPHIALSNGHHGPPNHLDAPPNRPLLPDFPDRNERYRCEEVQVTRTIALGPFARWEDEPEGGEEELMIRKRDVYSGPPGEAGGPPDGLDHGWGPGGPGTGYPSNDGYCQVGHRPMEVEGLWGCCACGATCTKDGNMPWTATPGPGGEITRTAWGDGPGATTTQTIWALGPLGWGLPPFQGGGPGHRPPPDFFGLGPPKVSMTMWGPGMPLETGSSSSSSSGSDRSTGSVSWTGTTTSTGITFGRTGTWTMLLNPTTTSTRSETAEPVRNQTENGAPTMGVLGGVVAGFAAVGAWVI